MEVDNKARRKLSVKLKLDAVDYAERHSNEGAAKNFKVDPKRIREWRKQKNQLMALASTPGTSQRTHLSGGGRKLSSESMENYLVEWIIERRAGGNRVSRSMIRRKAKELFEEADDARTTTFEATTGWLKKFLDRNGFSNRRVTSVAQKPPDTYKEKIVSFIIYVTQLRKSHRLLNSNIIAMDETAIYFDMISNTTIEQRGASTVSVRSTGHEKSHATVVLAAKGDGTKLQPLIVFKQSIREVKTLQTETGVTVISSKNGWMNEDSTCEWLDKVFGKFGFEKRLLVWDSYRCHLSNKVKGHLKKFNALTAVVPGGKTKFIQAPDVSWNKPFKDRVRACYDDWLAGSDNKEYTSGGNLKAPNKKLIIGWIRQAWKDLPQDLISNSFKSVGLTTALDGPEDDQIHCLKENQSCRAAWELLVRARDTSNALEAELNLIEEIDEDEADENEIVIYDDE